MKIAETRTKRSVENGGDGEARRHAPTTVLQEKKKHTVEGWTCDDASKNPLRFSDSHRANNNWTLLSALHPHIRASQTRTSKTAFLLH